jgi:hypothetical protein
VGAGACVCCCIPAAAVCVFAGSCLLPVKQSCGLPYAVSCLCRQSDPLPIGEFLQYATSGEVPETITLCGEPGVRVLCCHWTRAGVMASSGLCVYPPLSFPRVRRAGAGCCVWSCKSRCVFVPGPAQEEFEFTVLDSGSDGICCCDGVGYYLLYLGETVVASRWVVGCAQSPLSYPTRPRRRAVLMPDVRRRRRQRVSARIQCSFSSLCPCALGTCAPLGRPRPRVLPARVGSPLHARFRARVRGRALYVRACLWCAAR